VLSYDLKSTFGDFMCGKISQCSWVDIVEKLMLFNQKILFFFDTITRVHCANPAIGGWLNLTNCIYKKWK